MEKGVLTIVGMVFVAIIIFALHLYFDDDDEV